MKVLLTTLFFISSINSFAFSVQSQPLLQEDYASATVCNQFNVPVTCKVKIEALLSKQFIFKKKATHKEMVVLNPGICRSIGFLAPDNNSFVDVEANTECKQAKEDIFFFP